jgi:hypothetical protein
MRDLAHLHDPTESHPVTRRRAHLQHSLSLVAHTKLTKDLTQPHSIIRFVCSYEVLRRLGVAPSSDRQQEGDILPCLALFSFTEWRPHTSLRLRAQPTALLDALMISTR